MAKVHFILQGKGGVGKSFVAATLAQYLRSIGREITCVDTDPVNATFHGYAALNVKRLEIMNGDELDTRRFDELVEIIASAPGDVVVDNGANAFIPLSHYLISNGVPELLADMGHELIVHSVVTGGQAMVDTLSNFGLIAKQFAKTTIVVWLNPFWGAVEADGKAFEAMKVYTQHKDRVAAIVHIPTLKQETYGRDLSEVLQRRVTFDDAIKEEGLNIMVRQRLKMTQRELFAQMERASVL